MSTPINARTVLVVDDHEEIRVLLREILEERNYRVFEAHNGKAACAEALRNRIDLVITDLVMPEQEGIETIQMLRELVPGLKIIAISGSPEGSYLRVARHLGAHEAFRKPFSCHALAGAVDRLLEDPAGVQTAEST